MPYLATAQEWLTQSALLIEARPTSTRITTKYHLRSVEAAAKRKPRKPKASSQVAASTAQEDGTTSSQSEPQRQSQPAAPPPPPTTTTLSTSTSTTNDAPARATLTLKTYDPVSGSTLKYRTTKGQEVARLVQVLGRLGRGMAGGAGMAGEDVDAEPGAAEGRGDGGGAGNGEGAAAAAADSSARNKQGPGSASNPTGTLGRKGKKKGKR